MVATTIQVTAGVGNVGAFPFVGNWWEQSGAGYANAAQTPPFSSGGGGSASSLSVNGSTLQCVCAAASGANFAPAVSGPVFVVCFPAGLSQNFISSVRVTKTGGSQVVFNVSGVTQFNPAATGTGSLATLTSWVWSTASVAALFAFGVITVVEFDFVPPQTPVPNVVGDDVFDATAAIVAAGYTLGTVTSVNNETVPAGIVLVQSPVAGSLPTLGSPVNLTISLGPVRPQTLKAIRIVPQIANRIMVQFEYSPLGIL